MDRSEGTVFPAAGAAQGCEGPEVEVSGRRRGRGWRSTSGAVLSTELPERTELRSICAVQDGSRQPQVLTEHLKRGRCDGETAF